MRTYVGTGTSLIRISRSLLKVKGMERETVEHYVANMIAKDDVLGFVKLYKIMLRGSKKRIARSFRLFFNYDSLPAIVHCIHGKDRTGLIVALLQSLSGVPREVCSDGSSYVTYSLDSNKAASGTDVQFSRSITLSISRFLIRPSSATTR